MRKLLFYTLLLPITIIMMAYELLLWPITVILCLREVLYALGSRFEHWAYRVPKDYFFNSPYKRTLRQIFEDSWSGVSWGILNNRTHSDYVRSGGDGRKLTQSDIY